MNCQYIFYSVCNVVFINQNTWLHHIVPRQVNWKCAPRWSTTWSPTRHRKAPGYSAPQTYTREARAWQSPWWPLSQETWNESGRQCRVSWLLSQLLWDRPIFVTFLSLSALASASWFWSFVKFGHFLKHITSTVLDQKLRMPSKLCNSGLHLWPSIIYIFIVLHIFIVLIVFPGSLASWILSCFGLIKLCACFSGFQWLGIFYCHWWTASIKLRLLIIFLCKLCVLRTSFFLSPCFNL